MVGFGCKIDDIKGPMLSLDISLQRSKVILEKIKAVLNKLCAVALKTIDLDRKNRQQCTTKNIC